jgi:hypothetical protein
VKAWVARFPNPKIVRIKLPNMAMTNRTTNNTKMSIIPKNPNIVFPFLNITYKNRAKDILSGSLFGK